MNNANELRGGLVDYLKSHVAGPHAAEEILDENPCRVYSAGVLFPQLQRTDEIDVSIRDDEREGAEGSVQSTMGEEDPDHEITEEGDGGEEESEGERGATEAAIAMDAPTLDFGDDSEHDDVVLLANTYYPSAMGLSFLIGADTKSIEVCVSAATYARLENINDRQHRLVTWRRQPCQPDPIRFDLQNGQKVQEADVVQGLRVEVVCRREQDGLRLVTVSLANRHTPRSPHKPPSAKSCFFQSRFFVRSPDRSPIFLPYDVSVHRNKDEEEESLSLLYRNRRQFAAGHGCAAEWNVPSGQKAAIEVHTETVPSVKVPPVEATSLGGDALDIHKLASGDEDSVPDVVAGLPKAYKEWIDRISIHDFEKVPLELREAARRHIAACRHALVRMEAGVKLLRDNAHVLRAFVLANKAMLMQQFHSRLPNRELNDLWREPPVGYSGDGRWRSFQLAFILMNLPAFLPDRSGFEAPRGVVDLIWFPTGGGKTEAYLGLAAYAIFLRRLLQPTNGGCTILMRYTLRLLTAQQFQRAAALICACEHLRTEDEAHLGKERITIGLWVGGTASPNSRKEAIACRGRLAKLGAEHEGRRENLFQVLACPWCGTRLDRASSLGYVKHEGTVVFKCPESRCRFSKLVAPLPVTVIDEDIYERPPTVIIGTVDKFAMLAWKPEAAAIFGIGRSGIDPPDLIIQDELHLISGALGSMVGLFEAAIDYLCTGKYRPKIVASTATIRSAREQCFALYDRQAFQFPPPGLDISDSFFAAEREVAAGRLYVGVFATAAPSPVTALVRTSAALHQGAKSVPLPIGSTEADRDPYWTQLQYFGSLRELGRAATLVEQDIPEYLGVISKRYKLPKRFMRGPVELTGRLTAEQIPEILEDLKVRYQGQADDVPAKNIKAKKPIDVLLATNMISVGVDVPRLGLMVVVGQPKTTSEYIQASSRVGRSGAGLVVTLYNAGKPRDRSHYEQFRAYHEAFYRHVEPTSVTPFSIPVLERALHAILVIVARQRWNISKPDQLRGDDPRLQEFFEYLRCRSLRIDKEHAPEVMARLQMSVKHWLRYCPPKFGTLRKGEDGDRLLSYGPPSASDRDDASWRTPTSMRNVDAECGARVLQVPYDEEEQP
ncbi:MAG: helicase-related protein [Deltaproteobacteria bacterium]|nr:helicase-related protein [Deltaproteobacteria bacterium]